jgi:hypothetical protein
MAIFLWFLLRFALMQMGKKDPLMLDVFRHAMLYTDRLLHTQYIIPAHGAVDRTVPKHMLKRWLK